MRRPWQIWVAYALCLLVGLGALGWLSIKAMQVDEAEIAARGQAQLEENVRLALWRIDSAVSPLIAQENARPWFAYAAFYLPDRAHGPMPSPRGDIDQMSPSPLLTQPPPQILLHFQIAPEGSISSPQVPLGAWRERALMLIPESKIDRAERTLEQLNRQIEPSSILAVLPQVEAESASGRLVAADPQIKPFRADSNSVATQAQRANTEFQARSQYVSQNAAPLNSSNELFLSPDAEVRTSVMKPVWQGEDLLLARRAVVRGRDYVQACLLDWPAIRKELLSSVSDLVPTAALIPVGLNATDYQTRRLASLPLRLDPGPLPVEPAAGLSPIRFSLIVAWSSMLLVMLAMGALLQGVISLSERRAAFVSAVTHELRTPLTTFRMYAEMLAGGMVSDEEHRRSYLCTLQREAERLTHLVENVLAYAQLERGRHPASLSVISVDELLAPAVTQRLAERAEQTGLHLTVDAGSQTRSRRVFADGAAVEQILFNLVDNACKYAAGNGHALRLDAIEEGACILIRVADQGPGISAAQRRRLFQPFRKSARVAAHSAPGVGLGLALSRRLARQMQGDLSLVSSSGAGACFVLALSVAREHGGGV